jgi:hypothetical protein
VRRGVPDFLNMKQTTKDNLIYLGIGGTIAAALAFYVFYSDATLGRIPDIPGPILWGLLSTPGIVAIIFEQYWVYRRRGSLWIISAIAASLNILAIALAYRLRWEPPILVWSGLTVLGLILVFAVANRVVVQK